MTLIHLKGENGAELYFARDQLPAGVAQRIARGDLTEIKDEGTTGAEADEPADDTPPDAPPLPSRKAHQATWAKFAVSQGMDREEAAAMSKDDLIKALTKPAT